MSDMPPEVLVAAVLSDEVYHSYTLTTWSEIDHAYTLATTTGGPSGWVQIKTPLEDSYNEAAGYYGEVWVQQRQDKDGNYLPVTNLDGTLNVKDIENAQNIIIVNRGTAFTSPTDFTTFTTNGTKNLAETFDNDNDNTINADAFIITHHTDVTHYVDTGNALLGYIEGLIGDANISVLLTGQSLGGFTADEEAEFAYGQKYANVTADTFNALPFTPDMATTALTRSGLSPDQAAAVLQSWSQRPDSPIQNYHVQNEVYTDLAILGTRIGYDDPLPALPVWPALLFANTIHDATSAISQLFRSLYPEQASAGYSAAQQWLSGVYNHVDPLQIRSPELASILENAPPPLVDPGESYYAQNKDGSYSIEYAFSGSSTQPDRIITYSASGEYLYSQTVNGDGSSTYTYANGNTLTLDSKTSEDSNFSSATDDFTFHATTLDGDELGTFTVHTKSGSAVFTSSGIALTLQGGPHTHLGDPVESPLQILADYLEDFGFSTTTAALDDLHYNSLHSAPTSLYQVHGVVSGIDDDRVQVDFRPVGSPTPPGASVVGLATETVTELVSVPDGHGDFTLEPVQVVLPTHNTLYASGDLTGDDIQNIQELVGSNAALTAAQFAEFASIQVGVITAATAGTYSLANKSHAAVHSISAEDWGGTTLVGDDTPGQRLQASIFGDDTLVAGDGGAQLTGGHGRDTLVGGRGDDRFSFPGTPASGASVDGGAGENALQVDGDITQLSITHVQELWSDDVTLTSEQFGQFSTVKDYFGAESEALTIHAATGGIYSVQGQPAHSRLWSMVADSSDGTTFTGNDGTFHLTASAFGNDALEVGNGSSNNLDADDSLGDDVLTAGNGDRDNLSARFSLGNNVLKVGSGFFDSIDVTQSYGDNKLTVGNGDLAGVYASDSYGDNVLVAGDGNGDVLRVNGSTGNNILRAGNGNGDYLDAQGSIGDNILVGGNGGDVFLGGLGMTIFRGGTGDDLFNIYAGTIGTDILGGGGHDTLAARTPDITQVTFSGIETLALYGDLSITAAELAEFTNLVGGGAYNTVNATDAGTYSFADKRLSGAPLTLSALNTGANVILIGSDQVADSLAGGSGSDRLVVGASDTTVFGGSGFNSYVFKSGFGDDLVYATGNGVVEFSGGVTDQSLWFMQVGSDLQIVELGHPGTITFSDWFLFGANIEDIKVSNGLASDVAHVAHLVAAMDGYQAEHPDFDPHQVVEMPDDAAIQDSELADWGFVLSGGKLEIGGIVMPSHMISGFRGDGDLIDLRDVPYDSRASARLEPGNILHIVSSGQNFDLRLDSGEDYSNDVFTVSEDGRGGTQVNLRVVSEWEWTSLPDMPGATYLDVSGVDDAGAIIGNVATGGFLTSGFIYQEGSFTVLPVPAGAIGESVSGINNQGDFVGYYSDSAAVYGFVNIAGTVFTLPTPEASAAVFPTSINDSHTVVGYFTSSATVGSIGFIYQNGHYSAVADPLATFGTILSGINDAGDVVGSYYVLSQASPGLTSHGFLYHDGSFTAIDDPNATAGTSLAGIDSAGDIVGTYEVGFVTHSFLYREGVFTELLDPDSSHGTVVRSISSDGEIAGQFSDGQGQPHLFSARFEQLLEPPALTVVPSQTIEATQSGGAVATFSSSATDVFDGSDLVVFTEGGKIVSSGDLFALGRHVIRASVTDSAGLASSEAFEIDIVDTSAPTLSAITSKSYQAHNRNGAVATFAAIATDLVDGTDLVVFTEGDSVVRSGDTFAIGVHTITASATDAEGNSASEQFTINVVGPARPYVTNVTASGECIDTNGDGHVGAGALVTLTVSFSASVAVGLGGGAPVLKLGNGGIADYVSGSGTNELAFDYVVEPGKNTLDLAIKSLVLDGATITDRAGHTAILSGVAGNPNGVLQIDAGPKTVHLGNGEVNIVNYLQDGSIADVQHTEITGEVYSSYDVLYGNNGKPVSATFSNGVTEAWTYNSNGSIRDVLHADITGQAYTFYDVAYGTNNKPASAAFSDGMTAAWSYGAGGAVAAVQYQNVTGKAYTALERDFDSTGAVAIIIAADVDGTDTVTGHQNGLTISGSAADERIKGGGTNETFLFSGAFGHDTVMDFAAHISGIGHDSLIVDGIATLTELLASTTFTKHAATIVIDTNDTVELPGVTEAMIVSNQASFHLL